MEADPAEIRKIFSKDVPQSKVHFWINPLIVIKC